MEVSAVEHAGKAEALKVGTTKIESLNVKRIKVWNVLFNPVKNQNHFFIFTFGMRL